MRQVERAVEQYDGYSIVLSSFTRAAAHELASRVQGQIPAENIGTLHSLCFRMLIEQLGEKPLVAETATDKWNELHPSMKIAGELDALDPDPDVMASSEFGDQMLQKLGLLRAQMIPEQLWPTDVMHFWREWCLWKQALGAIDFTDMIEMALQQGLPPPRGAEVLIVDEAQDCTALELALVRRWASSVSSFIMAGDDDQSLYRFRGAKPEAFLFPEVSKEQIRILDQSYRLPYEVLEFSRKWIEQIEMRQPKQLAARKDAAEEGTLVQEPFSARHVDIIVERIEKLLEETDRTAMILTTCGYILQPIVNAFRKAGVPFHNPYARKRGHWNPLRTGSVKKMSTAQRVLAFLRPSTLTWGQEARAWTADDLSRWVQMIPSQGLLKHGTKTKPPEGRENEAATLTAWFTDECLETLIPAMMQMDEKPEAAIQWLLDRSLKTYRNRLEYPLAVARRWGGQTLTKKPRVCVGTIHSVKGGEASEVYLFPDVSVAGYREMNDYHQGGRDATIRQFYVGMTRAKERLHLCAPMSMCAVRL